MISDSKKIIKNGLSSGDAGFALLTAVVTTSILFLISYAVVNITVKELLLSFASQESQYSFYNADNGLECAMYWDTRYSSTTSAFDPGTPGTISCNNQTISTGSQTVPTQPPQSSVVGGSAGTVDVALGKTATQSSTLSGFGPAAASNAVDGNTDGNFFNGSVSHTNNDLNAWWQVDLGSSKNISSIQIWNRTDCCSTRLDDYWIFVSDTPFVPSDTPTILQSKPGVWNNHQTIVPNPSTTVSTPGVSGRYVRVQLSGTNYLSLAEVKVMASSATSGTSVFSVNYTHGCAIVYVMKSSGDTTINSYGYNNCDSSGSRRYERGISISY